MTETIGNMETLCRELEAEHEALCQRLHNSEMNKNLLANMLEECKEIVSVLENNTDDNEAELKECTIQKLKLQSESCAAQVSYENEIYSKNNEIKLLRSQLDKELMRIQEMNDISNVDGNKLETEIILLQDQHNLLIAALDNLDEQLTTKEYEHVTLLDKIKELENELNDYKEVVNCKKSKLEETTLLLNSLQDEYLDLKTEVDAATNKPLDAESRGNSLFAEVDDRRVQLQNNIQKMKLRYLDMKRQRTADLKEMATLRNDNTKLSTEIKKKLDENFVEEEEKMLLLREEVAELTNIIEDHKTNIAELLSEETSIIWPRLDIAKFLVTRKSEELSNVREQLQIKAKHNVVLDFKISDYKKQIQVMDTEIMKMESDIGELKTAIVECRMEIEENVLSNQDIDNGKENCNLEKTNKLRSIIKTTKIEHADLAVKCVQFAEESIHDNVSKRSSKRKGGVKVPSTETLNFF